MVCRYRSWGLVAAIVVAALQLSVAARSQERMQLGAPPGSSGEFRHLVGDRVFFSEGSAEIGARARKALEAQGAWLKLHPSLPVIVEGHADDPGARDLNAILSQRRADVVRQRLIEAGVAPERIRALAYGKERAVAVCPSPVCAAQNRRVVTVVGHASTALEPGADLHPGQADARAKRPPRALR